MEEKLKLLQKMMSPDFEYDEDSADIRELFNEHYKQHSYAKQGNRPTGTLECGSSKFKDTPKTLYRLFYFLSPDSVCFDDMYKSGTIIEIVSPDYNFGASFQFYKYEIGVYFHCSPEYHNKERNQIVCGCPSADNGQRCLSDVGNLWFETLVLCLNHEHEVCPGNSFVV